MDTKKTEPYFGGASGSVTLVGAGLFDLEGIFIEVGTTGSRAIHLHSMRFGDVVDGSESELEGCFYEDPAKHLGKCYYSLEEADDDVGVMVLTIKGKDKSTKIARLEGPSEGFGEAFVTNKKGHLHVHPSEHNNYVKFKGNSSIDSISFELDEYIVTKDQPFDGIHPELESGNANKLDIDVKAGRKGSSDCADFYKDFVGNDSKYMMHTRGGNVHPSKLNFAFTGTLYINNIAFEVCIGQGHDGSYNNWHLCSKDMDSSSNHKSGDLGAFHLSQDGSNTFEVKLA